MSAASHFRRTAARLLFWQQMDRYLHNMKKTCAEFDLLGFRGNGYFFVSNHAGHWSKQKLTWESGVRQVMRRYYGLILNASNVTHGMLDIYTGEPLYKSDLSNNEILQKLYKSIDDEIHHIALVKENKKYKELISSVLKSFEVKKSGNWFDRVWNKYVVGDGDRKKLYGAEVREYSYLEDMNHKLVALVNAYNGDNSIGKMNTADIIAKFGTHPRDIVAFRRWLKTKL